MKKILLLFFIGSFCTTCIAQNSTIFIKAIGSRGPGFTDGVFDGGSNDARHPHEIEALAYSDAIAGCNNIGKGTGAASCKSSKSPFSFSMGISFAVNSFKYNLVIGKFITSVDMVIRKDGEEPFEYYKVHMENVQVTAVSEGSGGEAPMFNIELDPQKVAWQIIKQNDDGPSIKSTFGWDYAANKAFNWGF